MNTKNLAKVFKVIGEENRLQIICLLFKNKKLCVSEIALSLNMTVANTSHHLNILEENNVLKSQRKGKEICYFVEKTFLIQDIKRLICKSIII